MVAHYKRKRGREMKVPLSESDIDSLNRKAFDLAELVDKAERNIRILTGEGLYLYNYPVVISAFERAKQRNPDMKIWILVSPIMFIAERSLENGSSNGLIELSEKGIIQLYRRPARMVSRHYCLVDDANDYYCEGYHSTLVPFNSLRSERLRGDKKARYINRFDEILGESKLSTNPKKDFILLTHEEINLLFKDLASHKVKCDELTYTELRLIVEEKKSKK